MSKISRSYHWRGGLYMTAVFKLGSADQRGSAVGSQRVRERIPKNCHCYNYTADSFQTKKLCSILSSSEVQF